MHASAQKTCLYCGLGFLQNRSCAIYSEVFCSDVCEKSFVGHLAGCYKLDFSQTRILAVMPQGNA